MTQALGQALENHPLTARRRTGVVQDLANMPGTIAVSLADDDPTNTTDLPYLDQYFPAVGDSVMMLSTAAGDHVVIGRYSGVTAPQMSGWIRAYNGLNISIPTGSWTELAYDTVTAGTGDPSIGQLSLNGSGKIVIPRTGIWIIVCSVLFPSLNYTRTLTGIDIAGAGSPSNGTRHDVILNSTHTHYNTSMAYPVQYTANTVVTGYAYQESTGTATLGPQASRIVGYQVG